MFGGYLGNETGWLRVIIHTVQTTLFGVRNVKSFLGARDPDVAQASLLLETMRIGDRPLVREQSVFHAADENERELQALGGGAWS